MSQRIRVSRFHYFANAVLRGAFSNLLRLKIEGLEYVSTEGALIAAINHTSFLDPILAIAYLRSDVLPMGKSEIFRFPFGLVFSAYGAFPVRRGEGDLQAIKRALQILHDGHLMLISPEGTRTKSGALQTAHEGTALLAIKSKAPILPVAMWGGKKFWTNLARLRRTQVGMRIGKPLVVAALDPKPSREELRLITDEVMFYIADLMPAEYRGVYADASAAHPRYVHPQGESIELPRQTKEVMPLPS